MEGTRLTGTTEKGTPTRRKSGPVDVTGLRVESTGRGGPNVRGGEGEMVKGTGNLGGLFRALVGIGALGLLVAGWTLLHGTSVAQAQAVSNDQTATSQMTVTSCDNQKVQMKIREYEVFRAHNAYRIQKGLPAFCVDVGLQAASQAHSTDMATRNFYSHINPDGKGPGGRLSAAGYSCYSYGAENIGVYYPETTSAEVTQSWINSTGHRANIENGGALRVGIASANDADFGEWYYGNADFGEYVNYTVSFAGNDCDTTDPVDGGTTPPPDDTDPGIGLTNESAPVIEDVVPAGSRVRDTTPRFSAMVWDAESRLDKSNIAVYIDGKSFSNFTYSATTDKVSGVSRKLTAGKRHTIRIVANDGDGKSASETARFTVR